MIPEMLRATPRARHGIHKADIIVGPPPVVETTPQAHASESAIPDIKIRILPLDTLSAAAKISERPFASKQTASAIKSRSTKPNVAVLNMASALRPGGGFLEGANSQEEYLCARTTLYPSLWDSFYRLPEVSGIFTPDVLVFRDHLPEANELAKRDRYFVDVITAAMLRFSDARAEGCTCGVSYCDKHRDLVLRKMKAVLRIAQSKGTERLVLGAWGCGAYGNPVGQIAKYWRKVIAGAPRQRRPNAERWEGIKEIIFAIPDRTMLAEFKSAFSSVLAKDTPTISTDESTKPGAEATGQDDQISALITKIAEVETKIERIPNSYVNKKNRQELADLTRDLAQGIAARGSKDEDLTPNETEDEDDFVISGYPGSDGEDNSLYNFDENDIASDSSDFEASEMYEFGAPQHSGLESQQTSHDELSPVLPHSPQLDPETGWYTGSVDALSALLNNGRKKKVSHASPVLRPDSGELGIEPSALEGYLMRFQGTDVKDY